MSLNLEFFATFAVKKQVVARFVSLCFIEYLRSRAEAKKEI